LTVAGIRDDRVDAYIDALPDWQAMICRRLRALIHDADSEIDETIMRGDRPYFVLHGTICALQATKHHVNLFLYDGGLSPDPAGIITAGHDNVTARQISITDASTINGPAVVAILRSIVADNRAGGWRNIKAARERGGS
jgi:hypothetical protein